MTDSADTKNMSGNLTALLREELAVNSEDGQFDEVHMRCTCPDCIEAVRVEMLALYTELADAAKYLPLVPEAMPGGPVVGEIVIERFQRALHSLHVFLSPVPPNASVGSRWARRAEALSNDND